ncbi:ImpA family metalloprotease [Shewanella fidelis]|uniref:ImpA family metalloprotease n=1 Tax=Shewanella fidelis TaxID=173509 RepID=A0AAW8NP40_9GAMM|nr:ImpA family metalloprotease [Shewanella fidelis]MDR8524927.1 ImpA family metalloprotease [Shewanella fidelis]MDW4810998.1 ImpA family metalloprotease [Shewanella fidelis]MDW4815223.1 ImpA family metalloprotease [Shewanella fidelis]MDW4819313.1 ImpA family metalloprotease [Shewanella fidelis]MDW4823009.1 ImpA family metalloprotease [Shewanella fidelis]
MKQLILSSFILLGLSACGGSDDSTTNGDEGNVVPPVIQAPTVELGDDITAWNDNLVTITADVATFATGTPTFEWQQLSGPKVVLSNSSIDNVTIDASALETAAEISLSLTVTDSANQTATDSVTLKLNDKISTALTTGDASLVQALSPKMVTRAIKHIDQYRIDGVSLLKQIYQDGVVKYDQGRHSQMIGLSNAEHGYPQSKAYAIVTGNKGLTFAATNDIAGQRNAAFGTDIISSMQQGNNAEFEASFKRLLAWMMAKDVTTLAETHQVRLFLMAGNTVSRINSWINENYPNWQVETCSDEANLNSCLREAQLVISGSSELFPIDTVKPLIAQIQSDKQPLLYVHLHSWNSKPLTQTVINPMGFSMQGPGGPGNYFAQDKADWSSATDMLSHFVALEKEQLWLDLFDSQQIDFNLANCATRCDDRFDSTYRSALSKIRRNIQSIESNRIDIFNHSDYTLYKLLILLGDNYRQDIQYPMDVVTTDSLSYLKAYYADHSVYNYRDINAVPKDLGNFSRTDFSHVTAINKEVSLISKQGFRSAGVYALPGRTVSVTRNDNNPVRTWIFINTLRSGSTHEFAENGYKRPKLLQSTHIEVKAGETIKFTSPYGGPMQINFDNGDLATEFSFSQVGLHPYWRKGMDGNQFMQALTANQYDWAELATEHFEVHSKIDKMQQTMAHEPLWNTPEKMADAIMTQVHNYPHLLAGFKGPFIDEVAEISDFANNKGWQIDSIDTVKHMNADQATCGAGCSGNPYDASWSFSPTGHGDIHELGHGLEKGRLRFDGHDGHASTNPYSYYTKSRAYTELGKLPSCQGLDIKDEFEVLQASVNQADPFAYMQSAQLTSWSSGMATMLQMMIASQKYGALENGWHLLARVHILLREFERAKANEETWQQQRTKLGFDQFSLASAQNISNNDFLMIAMSYATQLDYRQMYQMWGLATTQAAKEQVGSFGFTALAKQIYVYAPGEYCKSLDLPAVAIDGVSAWPL